MNEIRTRQHLETAVRWLPLVLVPLLLAASTFPGQYRVPWIYWALAMGASAVFVLGARWPLTVSIALSALAIPMFGIPAWGLSGLVPFLGAIALVDVVRQMQRNAPVALATVCWAAAVGFGRWGLHDPAVSWASRILEVGTFVGLPLLLGLYLRGQRALAANLRLRAADAENRRAEAEQRTRLVEREALARELHDLVAHHMASIVLRIGVARHVIADADPRVNAVLDDVRGTASDALADIRRLLTALRDPTLGDVALVDSAALRTEIEGAVQRVRAAGFTVDAEIPTGIDGLDAIGRLTLLRLVQESLTNVMKHADPAEPVTLVAESADGGIAVRVRNGIAARGVATAPRRADEIAREPGRRANPPGAHGIIGMRERVELAGGRVAVGATGQEWLVDAWLPHSAIEQASTSPARPDPTSARPDMAPALRSTPPATRGTPIAEGE